MESKKPTNKEKYINFINQSESMQEWLRNAPSQLLDYNVITDNREGLFRISILLKNAYLFDDDYKSDFVEGDFKDALLD
tara:strand:- start:489 stop:725 length:237 start_codon:yes stop_codon:yes gene_type:complete